MLKLFGLMAEKFVHSYRAPKAKGGVLAEEPHENGTPTGTHAEESSSRGQRSRRLRRTNTASVTAKAIDDCLRRRGAGARTRRNLLLVIRTMFNHAKSRGYLQKNQLDPESQPPKSLLADPLPETKCSTWFATLWRVADSRTSF